MYKIDWGEKALHSLTKLDVFLAKRILIKIDKLQENPFSQNVKRLKNSSYFRLRVGDYSVIFEIIDDKIRILKIGHRKNIYAK